MWVWSLEPENNETLVKLGRSRKAEGWICWIHVLGRVELADQWSRHQILHDASKEKTLSDGRRLGRKGVEETWDISADVFGPANDPRW